MSLLSLRNDPTRFRWVRLAAGIVAMMAVANLQYAWTLFTTPLASALNVDLATVQWAFTCFVCTQTAAMPGIGYIVDRYGPRLIVSVAALAVAGSWIWAGSTHSIAGLYVAYSIGGLGVGAVYGACVGEAAKWFPDRRGLCVGATVGAYCFGVALTVIPIARMIDTVSYAKAFVMWGIIQGCVVLIAAQLIAAPPREWLASWRVKSVEHPSLAPLSSRDYTPGEMLKSPAFYMLYAMMTLVAFGGLMVTAQLRPIAQSYGYDRYLILGAFTGLQIALLLDGVFNGMARPLWGWISDHIGRYETMALAFGFEAAAIAGFCLTIHNPRAFVVMSGLAFLAWGEIYSLFPAVIVDLFGSKYATTNFSLQYTSKGVASVLAGPGAVFLFSTAHSWQPVLLAAMLCNVLAAALAMLWLRPRMRGTITVTA
ncbi:MAG TPA: oxalate/formate MFS antiporter [Blastocatellia bacterium]